MKRTQVAALVVVLLLIAVVVGLKATRPAPSAVPEPTPLPTALPRLVDLGSTTCLPCKQMAPILEELKVELQGQVEVEFIDIAQNPQTADKYAINVIPTQIFLDPSGQEAFRHEGFYSKADILAKLRELKLLAEG